MFLARGILALIALAHFAAAQIGPDVIVGDLPATSRFGPVGTVYAYSVGTTSCNVGDQPLAWYSDTNQHPVITQNIFRLANGRFEQLGQGWMKHGFCALQGTVCSSCTPGGSCSALFPGCSDPYSSSLNGSQSGLGTKRDVNAATGVFPYPFTGQGSTGDALFKRIPVDQAELSVSGALYFISSHYMSPDEFAWGTQLNNESYRRVTVGTGFALNVAGTTQRQRYAVQAWADNDTGVTITIVDVPGDGRYILGAKAIDLGSGWYRYEYALENYNSDRSGYSFGVPLLAGVTATNVGFNDVDYHSGDPYDNTDWMTTVADGGVTWASTSTYAQNVNGNALRWDTVYSFWVEANAAPTLGDVALTLFKPGTPSGVQFATIVPGSAGGTTAPVNDNCASATAIGAGTVSFNTSSATTDGPAEIACFGAFTQIDYDVWYRYVAPCAGGATASLCGSTFDTRIAIYGGCPTEAGAIACNDDSCGVQSSVTWPVTAGTEYWIRVGGGGSGGVGTLTLTGPDCTPPGIANDRCANAIDMVDGVAVNGTTVGATNDGTANCGSSGTSADVWYRYTPAASASVTISTCNSASFDTVLSVHTGCGGSQVACLDDTSGCAGYTTNLVTNLTGGQTYLIRVAGYNGATGTFTLLVTGGGGGQAPPFNDECQNRAGVGLGVTTFDTRGGTTDGPVHAACGGDGQIGADVWFNHPATMTGTLTISTCGSGFDTKLAVYADAGCASLDTRFIACNDNACGAQAELTINIVSGTNYTIRVGGANGATGTGSLTLTAAPLVDCNGNGIADATDISSGTSADCNSNSVPDECDIAAGTSADENGNAIPDECEATTPVLWMTFLTATAVPGVGTVQDEDVVAFDPATGAWTLIFDGSDVGLGSNAVDALAVLPSGDLLISIAADGTIPGLAGGPNGSSVDDSDIVRFTPTSLGATTAGTFTFYFDGSDVGLSSSSEDVDSIAILPDGRLALSTTGNYSVLGLSGQNEDLIVFNATRLGAVTSGSFGLYFDGSDVSLANGDVDAAAIAEGGAVLLSTTSDYTVGSVTWADEDVAAFAPTSLGNVTAGSYSLLHDLSARGIASSEDLNSLELVDRSLMPPPGLLGRVIYEAAETPDLDFDGDGEFTAADRVGFLGRFSTSDADVNGDGVTDVADWRYFEARLAEESGRR